MTSLPRIERPTFKPTEAKYRHAISLIPPDTRDLTARLFGDPIPGDRRRLRFNEPTRFGDLVGSSVKESTAGG